MYVLFCYSNNGFKSYLADDLNFYIATNTAMKFKTKQAAMNYYKANNHFPIATFMFIQGPKGGIYRANSGA